MLSQFGGIPPTFFDTYTTTQTQHTHTYSLTHTHTHTYRWYPGSVVVAVQSDEGSVDLLAQLIETNSMTVAKLNVTKYV